MSLLHVDYADLPWMLALAWALDAALGDPAWFPHPVRVIGWAIAGLERVLRRTGLPLRLAGALLALLVPAATYAAVAAALHAVGQAHPLAGRALGVAVLYFCLATRCLADEARRIEKLLRAGDLPAARDALRFIVGRDTHALDEPEVCRAVVETVAENAADGVLTPLFYACLGGPALAMTYKAVSTLDSMVGYKNARYREFGWASARLEDAFSFVPARASVWLISLAAWLLRGRGTAARRIARRDGAKHPSPNAGRPEAAFAGALGVRLGGPATYGGVPSSKPFLGDPERPMSPDVIRDAVRLLWATSACGLALAAAAAKGIGLGGGV